MNKKHHELVAWQKSITLVKQVYKVTASFPKEEIYCLTNQMRRATISIPSNIAEGAARVSQKEFCQFLNISRGSLMELETQMTIAKELKYMKDTEYEPIREQMDTVFALISGLMKSVFKSQSVKV